MHNCMIRRWVFRKDAHCWLSMSGKLPFVPTVGMDLITHDAGLDFGLRILRVTWDMAYQMFIVDIASGAFSIDELDHCSCTPGDGCCVLRVEEWEDEGWAVSCVTKNFAWCQPYEKEAE